MRVKGKRIINPGSVSNPVGPDIRACYAILAADENGVEMEFFRVAYDHQKVIEILARINHPARRYITRHLRGENLVDL